MANPISVGFTHSPVEVGFQCPRHGVVHDVIKSWIEGYEGEWCTRCWVEQLMERRVCRVTRQPAASGTWPAGSTP